MDLPDYLPGNPPMYGVKLEKDPNYQGNTITIPVTLNVNHSDYTLTAHLRETKDTDKNVWSGVCYDGINIENDNVTVSIKGEVAKTIPSGTYYLAVVGNDIKNVNTVLFQTTISIEPTPGSPYPIAKSIPFSGRLPDIGRNWVYATITYYR